MVIIINMFDHDGGGAINVPPPPNHRQHPGSANQHPGSANAPVMETSFDNDWQIKRIQTRTDDIIDVSCRALRRQAIMTPMTMTVITTTWESSDESVYQLQMYRHRINGCVINFDHDNKKAKTSGRTPFQRPSWRQQKQIPNISNLAGIRCLLSLFVNAHM